MPDFDLVRAADDQPVALYDLLSGAEHELLMFCGSRPGPDEMAELVRIVDAVGERYGDLIELHLVFAGERPPGAPVVASTHHDRDARMHAAFGAARAALVLVRPDGYVAFRNQPADRTAILDYLTTIFTV